MCSDSLRYDIMCFLCDFSCDLETNNIILSAFIQMALKESDNNVRLAILAKLEQLFSRAGSSLDASVPDVLGVFLRYKKHG